MPHPPRLAVILAAGKGTRMRSALPKVLHRAAGRPLLQWVVDAARAAGCARILVVVGHGAEQVREEIVGEDLGWILQAEQRGTGHALAQAGHRDGYRHSCGTPVSSGAVRAVATRARRIGVADPAGLPGKGFGNTALTTVELRPDTACGKAKGQFPRALCEA